MSIGSRWRSTRCIRNGRATLGKCTFTRLVISCSAAVNTTFRASCFPQRSHFCADVIPADICNCRDISPLIVLNHLRFHHCMNWRGSCWEIIYSVSLNSSAQSLCVLRATFVRRSCIIRACMFLPYFFIMKISSVRRSHDIMFLYI